MNKTNIGLLVGGAVVLAFGFTFLFVGDLLQEASEYTTFERSKGSDKTVHIVGQWIDRENSNYDAENDIFQFVMQDSVGGIMTVRYGKPQPPNFAAAEKVVVVGKHKGDYFHCTEIVTKCPSKYGETDITGKESEAPHPVQ